jgi:predicted N-acetyltransferase YhbS
MEITYRFLDTDSKSDISQWQDLHSVCFKQDISSNFWDYIKANPFHKKTKPLVFIARAGERIVGSLSVIPSPITEYREGIIIQYNSLLLCKAMVHPDYQKKGIFSHLLKVAIETAKSEGYDIIITISNNPYSYQSVIRSGFHDVAAIRWSRVFLSRDTVFSTYIDALNLPSMIKKILISSFSECYSRLVPRGGHSYKIKQGDISEFIEEIKILHNSTRPYGSIYGTRTTDLIQWKFIGDDTNIKCFTVWEDEKMIGYAIIQLKKDGKNAYIVDIFFSKNQKLVISELVGEVSTYLKHKKFQILWISVVENNTILSNFFTLRNGFFRRSLKGGKLKKPQLLVCPLNNTTIQTLCFDKNHWNIQLTDTGFLE